MLVILKAIIVVWVALGLVNCTHKSKASKVKTAIYNPSAISVDPDIYKKVPFVDNSKIAMPYLSMNIEFSPVADIRKSIEGKEKVTLQHRGEAHITVLTPMEYDLLKKVLTMELINEVALLNRIQETPFEIICLGRGQLIENKKTLSTFFIVVDATELLTLRQNIATLYKTNGGAPNDFKPEVFYPHITVGFTERDLHLQDGVVKNKASCLNEMQLKAQ